MNDAATLVLPGLNGSGDGHWQRHWVLDQPDAQLVEQDNWTCPDLHHWRQRLEDRIAAIGDVWIVAHSLGCLLTANVARSPLGAHIRGALLVAPCDLQATERLHPCVLNFGEMPLDPLPFPSLVVASLDDPYMSFGSVQQVARCWGSQLIDIGAAGHINIQSGHGRWPVAYDLMRLVQGSSRRPVQSPSLQGKRRVEALASLVIQ
ncbi:alpha/beta hydrolase [Rhizobium sp. CG5]|uniref:RBBP9/YdeN family alpha/beta hydrolase n=1 Tax=Rhizobium sp. CG5 TaxID=2726076 RepID=UPI002033D67F